MRRGWLTLAAATLVVVPLNPAAGRLDPSDLCTVQTDRVERDKALPQGLLHAISLAETGLWFPAHHRRRPWPWTVTSGEQAYRLPTQEAALDMIRRLQVTGRTNIDVGCMQINLKHHGHLFANPQEILDPATNVAYAADFLQQLQTETSYWPRAIAYYHSRDPAAGTAYYARVSRIWREEQPLMAVADRRRPTLADGHTLVVAQKDHGRTVQDLLPLADGGNPEAQEDLADRYMRGNGVPQDDVQALKWYMLAALHGRSSRTLPLRELRARMAPERVRQAQELVLSWKPARRLPNIAQPTTGSPIELPSERPEALLHSLDGGGPVIAEPATDSVVDAGPCHTFIIAASVSTPAEGYEMYLRGEFERAATLFRRAAENGDHESQFMLGGLYALGLGLPQDHVEAYRWLSLAAWGGDRLAHRSLAALADLVTPQQRAEVKRQMAGC